MFFKVRFHSNKTNGVSHSILFVLYILPSQCNRVGENRRVRERWVPCVKRAIVTDPRGASLVQLFLCAIENFNLVLYELLHVLTRVKVFLRLEYWYRFCMTRWCIYTDSAETVRLQKIRARNPVLKCSNFQHGKIKSSSILKTTECSWISNLLCTIFIILVFSLCIFFCDVPDLVYSFDFWLTVARALSR